MAKCSASSILHEGVEGKFRGNAQQMGWQSLDGQRSRVLSASAVRRAEWFEGKLKILAEAEDGSAEVLSLENFSHGDYDALWRYLEESCGVYLKKVKAVSAIAGGDFDAAMVAIEGAADRVDEAAAGTVQKKAKEAELMKQVERVRDGLDQAVRGDKQALSRVFAANGCERIGRLRLVVDTVQLEVYHSDPRWQHLQGRAATVEAVLRELGTFRQWRPQESEGSLARRQILRELQQRQGVGEAFGEAFGEAPRPAPGEDFGEGAGLEGAGLEDAATEAAEPAPPASAQPAPCDPLPPRQQPDAGALPVRPAIGQAAAAADPRGIPACLVPKQRASSRTREKEDKHAAKTHAGSVLEGWVWKRSRVLKRWRRRWLVLMPDKLMTFKQKHDTKPTEVVQRGFVYRVYSADMEMCLSKCFCVSTASRDYYMICDEEKQRQAWLQEVPKALRSRW
ncbi:unnamed protein product [Prorocentrum cordatum]|uniref:PH domain-containing protein n=1 Tax=Prorocentrum cordatum TaxID=2364126 RepID=A0ABN9PJ55_9DINO|nr:unnamed protein product [Polarella glacialis]